MNTDQDGSFITLSKFLAKLPELKAPKHVEAAILAKVLPITPTIEAKSNLYWNRARNTLLVLSTPLWAWLALQSQHLSMNKFIWNIATINDRLNIDKFIRQWLLALTPISSAIIAMALIGAITIYIGITSIMWSMLQNSTMQGKSV